MKTNFDFTTTERTKSEADKINAGKMKEKIKIIKIHFKNLKLL